MYAILHLPTGHFLGRGKGPCVEMIHYEPARETLVNLIFFYSKKDAEKYKRSFLVALYSMVSHDPEDTDPNVKTTTSLFIRPKKRPTFLKKRRMRNTYHLQSTSFYIGLQSLQYYPLITNPLTGHINMCSANEFVVVKV